MQRGVRPRLERVHNPRPSHPIMHTPRPSPVLPRNRVRGHFLRALLPCMKCGVDDTMRMLVPNMFVGRSSCTDCTDSEIMLFRKSSLRPRAAVFVRVSVASLAKEPAACLARHSAADFLAGVFREPRVLGREDLRRRGRPLVDLAASSGRPAAATECPVSRCACDDTSFVLRTCTFRLLRRRKFECDAGWQTGLAGGRFQLMSWWDHHVLRLGRPPPEVLPIAGGARAPPMRSHMLFAPRGSRIALWLVKLGFSRAPAWAHASVVALAHSGAPLRSHACACGSRRAQRVAVAQ